MSKQPIEPDKFDYLEQDVAGDAEDSTWIPPDEPLGSHSHGITAAEEREGETFDERTSHTNPEVFEEEEFDVGDEVGRLVQPGDEDAMLVDDESNTVATNIDGQDDLSAEEAAMHSTTTD